MGGPGICPALPALANGPHRGVRAAPWSWDSAVGLYEPRFGRFVQADPVVDDGLDGQAYNRYSYVTNNPLRYTDPSGFRRSGSARSAGVSLFAFIVFNIAAPGSGFPAWLWSALQGATVGAVGAGNSSGAAWGAVSGLTFHGIGALKLGPACHRPGQRSHS